MFINHRKLITKDVDKNVFFNLNDIKLMAISIKWKTWIQQNKQKIKHPYDYEEKFVETILAQIKELSPDDVYAQFPFKDKINGDRRIDFMIINEAKGLRLAIEVDGLAKVQPNKEVFNYTSWSDMLSRQNALLSSIGCMLLRYSNQSWKFHAADVRQEIRSELLKQELEFTQNVMQRINAVEKRNQLEIQLQKKEIEIAKTSKDLKKISELESKIDGLLKENRSLQKNMSEQASISERFESEKNKILNELAAINANLNENGRKKESLISKNPNVAKIKNERIAVQGAQKIAMQPAVTLNSAQLDDLANKINQQFSSKSGKTNHGILFWIALMSFLFLVFGSVFYYFMNHYAVNEEISSGALKEISKPNSEKRISKSINEVSILTSEQAINHVGEMRTVCGKLVQMKSIGKANFLNFDSIYPNTEFSAVIWDENASLFTGINQKIGDNVCINGLIELYKDRPRIQLTQKKQITTETFNHEKIN